MHLEWWKIRVGKNILWWYILGKKMYLFFNTLCIILGQIFSISSSILKTLTMRIWHKSPFIILFIFQMIMFFHQKKNYSHTYTYTYTCLNEKPHPYFFVKSYECNSSYKIEMDNEVICNIWLNISLGLVIIWMVFEVYLHFAIYQYNYNFSLISFLSFNINFKKGFFLQSYYFGFGLPYSKHYL